MKFKIIGNSSTGGDVHGDLTYNFIGKIEYNCTAECSGEYKKGDDISDEKAIDFIISWYYSIFKGIGREYHFHRTQHYRISEADVPVTDKDLEPVVEETYLLMKDEFDRRNIKEDLLPLEALHDQKKSSIVEQLKNIPIPTL